MRLDPHDARTFRPWIEQQCARHRIAIVYTAQRGAWFAVFSTRQISIPPPIDRVTLSIGCHELSHIVRGRCPQTGDHFRGRRGCLECERLVWADVRAMLPFVDAAMITQVRQALGSYVRGVPAPHRARQAAKAACGNIAALEDAQKIARWELKRDKLRALAAQRR